MSKNDSDNVVTDEAIAKVMALGFDHQQAVDAIMKAEGDVGVASMMLSCDQVINEVICYDVTMINNM